MGLEPTRPQWPRDFKSLVSTDSTIQASGMDSGAKILLFIEKIGICRFFSFCLVRNGRRVFNCVRQIQQERVRGFFLLNVPHLCDG